MKFNSRLLTAAMCLFTFLLLVTINISAQRVALSVLGTYATGIYNQGAAEIVAYDPQTRRLFVVNGATSKIDVLSIASPSNPTLLFSIDVSPYGRQANSVAVKNGIVAAAVEAVVKTDPGKVVFYNADGSFLNSLPVGVLPDMVTFTPNGLKVLVANEAEPNSDYTIDPEGSVSIVDISGGVANATVTTAGFAQFNGTQLAPSIRIFGPNATVAKDLEPEYISVAPDGLTAWVTLQENNAVGVLNLTNNSFTSLIGLGFKNHNLTGFGLDASDRDNANNIANWQVFGMYQPDAVAVTEHNGETFFITANEGDAREYTGFIEEVRVSSLMLDPTIFPNAATLKMDANLGRLTVTNRLGDTDNDGDFDALYVFGGRSFSIWRPDGEQIFDSGDSFEQITSSFLPPRFNAGHTTNARDDRSDNKGPEPEGVAVGEAFGRKYAFFVLERFGGVAVYDITNPFEPRFAHYINNRNFEAATNTAAAGDLGPEGLQFIPAGQSPNGRPMLVVANEVSGTTTVYQFRQLTGRLLFSDQF